MRSSVRRAALVATALGMACALTPSAAFADAYCRFDFVVTVSPGISTTPMASTFTTGGPTGTAVCTGDIGGKAITGPGTFGNEGQFGPTSTCATGGGSGTARTELPTADGSTTLEVPFTFSYATAFGSFSGSNNSGGFMFTPTKGDCLTAPITESHVYSFGQIKG